MRGKTTIYTVRSVTSAIAAVALRVSMMTAFKKSELAESDRAIACSSATARYGLTTTTGHRLTRRHRLLLSPKYRLLPSIAAYGSSEFQPRIASARGLGERFGSAIAGGEVWLWAFYH